MATAQDLTKSALRKINSYQNDPSPLPPPAPARAARANAHGVYQSAHVDPEHAFATLPECTRYIERVAQAALTQDEASVIVKCLPVPSRNDH